MSDNTSLPALLSRAGERLGSLLPLAVVPLAIAVVSVERFRRIAESGADVRFGISFGFPTTVTTAWDLLSLPSAGPGLNLPTERLETTVLVMLVLAAGASALVALPLALVFLLALFAFAYLFYAAPYLVVVEGIDLPTALRRPYGYATSGGEYASFSVQYLVAVTVVPVVATPPFTTSGAGAALGTVVLAPVALLFDTVTMLFVRDLSGATGRGEGTGPDGAGDSTGTEAGTASGTGRTAAGQSNMPVET